MKRFEYSPFGKKFKPQTDISKKQCQKLDDNYEFNKIIKGALSDLRQFLTSESPLKIMRTAFYFTSNALLVLKILKFLS